MDHPVEQPRRRKRAKSILILKRLYPCTKSISFEDFITTYKGEQGAKAAGKMRAEGKDYTVKDGAMWMNFLFNV